MKADKQGFFPPVNLVHKGAANLSCIISASPTKEPSQRTLDTKAAQKKGGRFAYLLQGARSLNIILIWIYFKESSTKAKYIALTFRAK